MAGNKIADIAEVLIEIRTTRKSLDAKKVIQWIRQKVSNSPFRLTQSRILNDVGPLLPSQGNLLKKFETVLRGEKIRINYADPNIKGY